MCDNRARAFGVLCIRGFGSDDLLMSHHTIRTYRRQNQARVCRALSLGNADIRRCNRGRDVPVYHAIL